MYAAELGDIEKEPVKLDYSFGRADEAFSPWHMAKIDHLIYGGRKTFCHIRK